MGGTVVFDINDNGVLIKQKYDGFQSRPDTVVGMLESANKAGCLPKIQNIAIHTGDIPPDDLAAPHISISTTKDKANLLFPDPYSISWPEANIPDVPVLIREMYALGSQEPVYSRAFWIGNPDTHEMRKKFLEEVQKPEYSGLVEARTHHWDQGKSTFVSLHDHVKYKYLIDVEGNGFSGRLKYLLSSRRPVFVTERPLWDWATHDLIPWVHYIPLNRDSSDLFQRIQWAITHPAEAQAIADRVANLMKVRITRSNIDRYICARLHALTPNPNNNQLVSYGNTMHTTWSVVFSISCVILVILIPQVH